MPDLTLTPAAFEHLAEIMREETDGVDPRCLYCHQIIKAINEVYANGSDDEPDDVAA